MATTMELPRRVASWRDVGRYVSIDDHRVFVIDAGDRDPSGRDPAIVLLHGFPGSSYDFSRVVPLLARHRRVVAFDLLGYGLSDKPPHQLYSLLEASDLTEAVLDTLGVGRCVLVSHDMGDSIAGELLHQHNAAELGFQIDRVFLTNGAIFLDLAQLTDTQRLALALPSRPLPFDLPEWLLRRGVVQTFSSERAPAGVVDDMVSLIRYGGGARLLTRQISYVQERRINSERWTAALVGYDGPMTMIWGAADPLDSVSMTDRLATLRPDTEVLTWSDVGHWPAVEAPERFADAIATRV